MYTKPVSMAVVASLLVSALALPAQASLTVHPDNGFKIVTTSPSGAVGSTVPLNFSIKFIADRCSKMDVYIQTQDSARQKLTFVSATGPGGAADVTAEKVHWPKTEFENGVTMDYKVSARIDRGTVGEEIKGFYLYSWCDSNPNAGVAFGTIDDLVVKVTASKITVKPVTGTELASIFKSVYGRRMTASEQKYWAVRAKEKADRTALKGAMAYAKQKNAKH